MEKKQYEAPYMEAFELPIKALLVGSNEEIGGGGDDTGNGSSDAKGRGAAFDDNWDGLDF